MIIALSGKIEKIIPTPCIDRNVSDKRHVVKNLEIPKSPDQKDVDHKHNQEIVPGINDSSIASLPLLEKHDDKNLSNSSVDGWKWSGYWSFGSFVRSGEANSRFSFEYTHYMNSTPPKDEKVVDMTDAGFTSSSNDDVNNKHEIYQINTNMETISGASNSNIEKVIKENSEEAVSVTVNDGCNKKDHNEATAVLQGDTQEVVGVEEKNIAEPIDTVNDAVIEKNQKEKHIAEKLIEGVIHEGRLDERTEVDSGAQNELNESVSAEHAEQERVCHNINGDWKGSFEALTGLKSGPKLYNVSEKFTITTKVNPGPGASYTFDETTNEDTNLTSHETKGLVLVTGNGENEFGLFELIGSFNCATKVLQCQRRYVKTYEIKHLTNVNAESESIARGRKRRSSYSAYGSLSTTTAAAAVVPPSQKNPLHNTRKRQLSWKRHSISGDNNYIDPTSSEGTSIPSTSQGGEKSSRLLPASPARRSQSAGVLSQHGSRTLNPGTNPGEASSSVVIGVSGRAQGGKKMARVEHNISKDSNEGNVELRNDRKRAMSHDTGTALMTEVSEGSNSRGRKRGRKPTDKTLSSPSGRHQSKSKASNSLSTAMLPPPPLVFFDNTEESYPTLEAIEGNRVARHNVSTQNSEFGSVLSKFQSTGSDVPSTTNELDNSTARANTSLSINVQHAGGIIPTQAVTIGSDPPPALLDQFLFNLPHAGDPSRSRWRDAHFLYFQKSSSSAPTESLVNGIHNGNNGHSYSIENPASKSATANGIYHGSPSFNPMDDSKFVVYEGDMFNSQRHGRGICLYSNNGDNSSCTLENMLLYEGDWQFDKEHGSGTLMTSDRKSIIYQVSTLRQEGEVLLLLLIL